jgi:chaperonin cofactor prefoldin|tara:strand:+ start:419 stop:550 length:132 start_codon:yes stop_codon:yes gene_type:complete
MHIHMLENRVFDLESQVKALEYRLHQVEKELMNLINISVDCGK